jgi:hypothetical protein
VTFFASTVSGSTPTASSRFLVRCNKGIAVWSDEVAVGADEYCVHVPRENARNDDEPVLPVKEPAAD